MVPLGALHLGDEVVHGLGETGPAARGELGQHLGHGQDVAALEVLHPALGGGVEGPHGVQLVPEELAADGVVPGGGKEVQDAPPQGELAHAFHLVAPDVAGGGEGVGQLVQVVGLPHPEGVDGLKEEGFGQGPLEEGLRGGHHQGCLPLGHGPEDGEPPVLPLPGDHGGVVEGELPAGEEADLFAGEGAEVLGQALGLPLVGAHHRHRPAGPGPEPGGKMGAVDRRQAGHGRRAGARVQGGEQGAEFRHPVQDVEKLFHTVLLWRWLEVAMRFGGRPQAAPTKYTPQGWGRGGLWPPDRPGRVSPSVILSAPLCHSERPSLSF